MKLFYFIIFILCTFSVQSQPIQLVKDINPAVVSNQFINSSISNVTTIGKKTYFTADDGTSGRDPWITDGTTAGTRMLHVINPGLLPSIGNVGADSDAQFTYSNGFFFKQTMKPTGTSFGKQMEHLKVQ